MGHEIIDFSDERSRHGHLYGRKDVLDKLRGLVGERGLPRGWVLLLGSPGVGKSAIVTAILDSMSEPSPPHHFIRRGSEGWDRPEVVVQNLCAQIERRFEEKANPELPSERRLGDLLKRISQRELRPQSRRLVLVIDGLDEAASNGENPLPRFLPRPLPAGVVILCASRPMYPHLDWLLQQEGVRRVDLDDADWAPSNEAACREFWEDQAQGFLPPLDRVFIDAACHAVRGNLLHATRLRDWLYDLPPARRVASQIPSGIEGFLNQIWREIHALSGEERQLVVRGLCLACAAREALPIYLFDELLGGLSTSDGEGKGESFLRATRPFLLEEATHGHPGHKAYRPYHDHFRAFIAGKVGEAKIRAQHRLIAAHLATWPIGEGDVIRRRYALRHAVAHRIEAGDARDALRLVTDVELLTEKCRELGVAAVERDLESVARASSVESALDLSAVLAALGADAQRLSEDPGSLPVRLYDRLRCAGWPADRITRVLRFEGGLPRLRLLHGVRLGPALLRTFAGHEKAVVAGVAAPDGKHLVSASADRTLRLWVLATGEQAAELSGHEEEITGCAVTPDSALLISTSTDTTVRIWDLAERRCLDKLPNDDRWATACAVSPDGRRLVVGSDNGVLTVWDLPARRRLGTLTGHADYLTACVITADGKLITASRDRTVRAWDLGRYSHLGTLVNIESAPAGKEEHGWVTALTLLPGEREVLAALGDGTLIRCDLTSSRAVSRFAGGQGRVDACAALPGGGHVICGMVDGSLTVWSLADEAPVLRLEAHAGAVSACGVTRDGRRLFTASQDRSLKLWDFGGAEALTQRQAHEAPITACAFTPDGRIAVSASEDHRVKLWDLESGAGVATITAHPDLVTACAVSADGRRVVSGGRDGSVRLWTAGSYHAGSAEQHWHSVIGCAFLPDGRFLTASRDGAIWITSPADLHHPVDLGVHEGSLDAFAATPNGALALTASCTGLVKIWDVSARRCTQKFVRRPDLLAASLSPDGHAAALTFADGALEIHNLRDNRPPLILDTGGRRAFGCAISPDGRRVFTASEDGRIRAFDVASGAPLGALAGTSWFRCVAAARGRICAGDQEGNLWMIIDDTGAPPVKPQRPKRNRLSPEELVRARDALARIFIDAMRARDLAAEAGIDELRLDLSGSPSVFWQSILREAMNRCLVVALIRCALKYYPEDAELGAVAEVIGAR